MKEEIFGWGNYPRILAEVSRPVRQYDAIKALCKEGAVIARGLGRSYGDSSLSDHVISTAKLNRLLEFNPSAGTLLCEAGVSLKDILNVFVPEGWFLPVTPGTKFVTLGGAIASDVHGKNHHKEGSFSDYVSAIELLLPEGKTVLCSRTENPELFRATAGGMGLTGLILSASIKLKKIETAYIIQKTIRARNISEVMEMFEIYKDYTYSVAWIDCLSKGDSLGRCVLFLGEHAGEDDLKNTGIKNPLSIKERARKSVPFYMPNFILNSLTVRIFNSYYYRSHKEKATIIDYDSFFYPLDSILNWNRIYGRRGFLQYQCVLPKEASAEGLKKMLLKISSSGMGSFLGVLKLMGRGNGNPLSFPMEGYTLALDFPADPKVFALFEELDRIVLNYNGRLYLTKDARMNGSMLRAGYQGLDDFLKLRKDLSAYKKFQSLQSRRLGI